MYNSWGIYRRLTVFRTLSTTKNLLISLNWYYLTLSDNCTVQYSCGLRHIGWIRWLHTPFGTFVSVLHFWRSFRTKLRDWWSLLRRKWKYSDISRLTGEKTIKVFKVESKGTSRHVFLRRDSWVTCFLLTPLFIT